MSQEISIGYLKDPLDKNEKILVLKEQQYKTCIPINNNHPPGMYIDFNDQLNPLTEKDLNGAEYQDKLKDGSFTNATVYLNKSIKGSI